MEKTKIVAIEVPPDERRFSDYFDNNDGFTEAGGENCSLYIVRDDGWCRLSGFQVDEYKKIQNEMATENWRKDKEIWHPGSPSDVAAYLTRKTGVQWRTKQFHGYSQGDYCDVVYCPDHYTDEALKEAGLLWLGCGTEFTIDECGGYFVIDEVRWKEGAPLRKVLADMHGCEPDELEVQLYTGEHKVPEYKIMEG